MKTFEFYIVYKQQYPHNYYLGFYQFKVCIRINSSIKFRTFVKNILKIQKILIFQAILMHKPQWFRTYKFYLLVVFRTRV